jgi:hypothetical protein
MSKNRTALVVMVLIAAATVGCTEDPLFPERSIQVTSADMPPIVGDAVYELWLSYPNERVNSKEPKVDHNLPEYFSAGRFLADESGALMAVGGGPATFAIPPGYNPALIAEALVSVEARNDNDSLPDAIMLSGVFVGSASRGHAILQTSGARAFDSTALALRGGRFVLEAPTSPESGDALSGLWFVDHQTIGDPLAPGLSLPVQPLNHDNDNWTYESWLTVRAPGGGTDYISLGRFRNPASVDENGAGPGAGTNPAGAYRYPGEDFVAPPRRRLNDSTYGVVVSMQPTGVALDAPLVRLLERSQIGVAVTPGEDVVMSPTAKLPIIEVTIER